MEDFKALWVSGYDFEFGNSTCFSGVCFFTLQRESLIISQRKKTIYNIAK